MDVVILVLTSVLALGIGLVVPGVIGTLRKIEALVYELRSQVLRLEETVYDHHAALDRAQASLDEAAAVQSGRDLQAQNDASAKAACLAALSSLRYEALSGQVRRFQVDTARGGHALPRVHRRSVMFLHQSYYHFYYLARALRERGWDAVSVSLEDPAGANAQFYHGQDISLYSSDPAAQERSIRFLFEEACERYELLHFAGDGCIGFFPQSYGSDEPRDILEWRARGKRVAYTVSGCNSCVSQGAVSAWSALDGRVACDACIWQGRPDACSDERSLQWGQKVSTYCDIVFAEGLPALDHLRGPRVVREPVTKCLDPRVWRSDLDIPPSFRVDRHEGELLVYHSFGNYHLRSNDSRNIKGTPAVMAAVERLKKEGLPVRLLFVTDVRSLDVKYLQAQADVVVDQLHYGRYGANCREAMMLGRPVICYLNRREMQPENTLRCLEEIPAVSATPDSLVDELRSLLLDPERRARLGAEGRRYAIKWHSAEACAERYERIYDALMDTGRVPPRDLYLPAGSAEEPVGG